MRKYRSPTTALIGLVEKKAQQLLDARIEAAVVEYAEICMNPVDFRDIEARIADAKKGGFPPPPRWRQDAVTVEAVPEAQGNFRF